MNYLNKYCAHKIHKRIEIKRKNLKLLLPEPKFLNFIEELEKFKQIIEGVDSDDPSSYVDLQFVHTQYESLLNSYQELVAHLKEKCRAIDERTRVSLLRELLETICEAIVYLDSSLVDFYTGIIVSTKCLYSIRSILFIHDLLYDLKSDICIVRKNFYNIQKNACRRQIKETWTNIYSSALKFSRFKIEELNKIFPKLGNRLNNRHIAYTISRSRIDIKAMAQPSIGAVGSSENDWLKPPQQICNRNEAIAEETDQEDLEEEGSEKDEAKLTSISLCQSQVEQLIQTAQISHPIESPPKFEKESTMFTSSSTATRDGYSQDKQTLDTETYIKSTFGKPLRQALAAITIHQPTDPIYYLANYLLQYRQNELRNIERKQEFEDLLVERGRYSKKLESESKHRQGKCDPCSVSSQQVNQ